MDKNNVSYLMHESEVARLERIIKRLWILCIIIFTAFVISNSLWLYYESQWQTVEVSQDAENGINNFVGNDGEIINGKTDDQIPQEKSGR